MRQKIIKVGNSIAVTIPKEYAQDLQLVTGQFIQVELNRAQGTININPDVDKVPATKKVQSLAPEFIEWADRFITDNIDLFKELANR